jgi:hypothetical protein
MEQTISAIIQEFGAQLWLTAVTLIITTFVMTWIKNKIRDLANYLQVRSSSIGEQSIVIISDKKYLVEEIKFRTIKLVNGDDIMFIPLSNWIHMNITVPRYKDGIDIATKTN